ncbi:MAG: chromate efflux transporter [Paraglaciecola sp.]|nr:chromate efflux transporter [Paraglaciecola sp.]
MDGVLSNLLNIFWRFFALGCISFGGPAAHIGYFQATFVKRLKWLSQENYATLVAASQFLPGPGSSQVGFAIGLHRAGLAGGLTAFLGFTLPSFCIMLALANYMHLPTAAQWVHNIITGLMLLAVAVVADAILTMAQQFCRTVVTRWMALAVAVILLCVNSVYSQIVLLSVAAFIGFVGQRHFARGAILAPVQRRYVKTTIALTIFVILFIASALVRYFYPDMALGVFDIAGRFYQSGSLVFGGGHVVLPLLQQNLGTSVTPDAFLLAYGAAQGVPGPMFSIATFLGANMMPDSPLTGACVATISIFLPGLLLMYALHQQWAVLSARPAFNGAMAAINAAVVGLLFSAWVNPVVSHAMQQYSDALLVLVLLVLYRFLKWPVLLIMLLACAYTSILR